MISREILSEKAKQQAKSKASAGYSAHLDDTFEVPTRGSSAESLWVRDSRTQKEDHRKRAQIPGRSSSGTPQIQELIAQIQSLEKRLLYLESKDEEPRSSALEGNSFSNWLESNSEELCQRYPNKFVAVDIDSSDVIAAADDEDDFAKLLDNIDTTARGKIFTVHTSTIK